MESTLTSSILMSELIWLPHFASQCNFYGWLIDLPSAKTLKSQHSYMWKILKTSKCNHGYPSHQQILGLQCQHNKQFIWTEKEKSSELYTQQILWLQCQHSKQFIWTEKEKGSELYTGARLTPLSLKYYILFSFLFLEMEIIEWRRQN
jgi:hypothetical protein